MFIIPIGIIAALLSVLGVIVAARDLFRATAIKKETPPPTSAPALHTEHSADALAAYTNELQLSLTSLFQEQNSLQQQRLGGVKEKAVRRNIELYEFARNLTQETSASFNGVNALLTNDLDQIYALSQELTGGAWYRTLFRPRPLVALQEKLNDFRSRQDEIQLEFARTFERITQVTFQWNREYLTEQEEVTSLIDYTVQEQSDFALSLTATIFAQLRNIVLVLTKEHLPEEELAALMNRLDEKLSEISNTLKNIASQ